MDRTIASIFFDEIVVDRPLYNGHYVIPAVKKGERPYLLRVTDKIQMEPMPLIAGGGQIPRTIMAESIARDIVQECSERGYGMSIASGPGIWVVREFVPEVDANGEPVMTSTFDEKGKPMQRQAMRPATPQERDQMFQEDLETAHAKQDAYGEWLILQGDIFDEKPEQRVLIGKRSKLACAYYGQEKPWLKELKHDSNKRCQFCTATVPFEAIKCPKCGEIIDYERYEAEQQERKSVVARLKATKVA